jgi:hemerythrin-like domain-containing protein
MNREEGSNTMKPTEVLEREHQVIEQVAGACGTCAAALRKGVRIPFDILRSTIAFLRVYGDQYHNQEEERLFALLRERGVPAGSCPIATLEHEKQKLATMIDQLSAAVDIYIESGGAVSATLTDTLQAVAEFYPDHIWKENYLLLPMADKVFTEADQQALAQALRTIDSNRGEEARRIVEEFNAAILQCSESASIWDQAAIA